ncbi:MAG: hypothetical protein IPO02_16415, partial [Bacteroidetes bacterium]|nr:hypothetical protein [Bacteroidota bacterium]
MFSWPNLDSYWYQKEHDSMITQQYYAGLSNCNYFYNYIYHSFPPCATADSFCMRVNAIPKAFIVPIENECRSDSMHIKVALCGAAPYHFDLYKDSVFFNSYISYNDTLPISIFEEGIYQVKSVVDASPNNGIDSKNIL